MVFDMGDELVVLRKYANSVDADMDRLKLADEGIEAVVTGDMLPYTGMFGPFYTVELHVRKDDFDKAYEILKQEE